MKGYLTLPRSTEQELQFSVIPRKPLLAGGGIQQTPNQYESARLFVFFVININAKIDTKFVF